MMVHDRTDTRSLIPTGVTLDQRIELALQRINDLDQQRRSWLMSIPPQWDDSDILLSDLIWDMKEEINRLRAATKPELHEGGIGRYAVDFRRKDLAAGTTQSLGSVDDYRIAQRMALETSLDDKHCVAIYDRILKRDVWTSDFSGNSHDEV